MEPDRHRKRALFSPRLGCVAWNGRYCKPARHGSTVPVRTKAWSVELIRDHTTGLVCCKPLRRCSASADRRCGRSQHQACHLPHRMNVVPSLMSAACLRRCGEQSAHSNAEQARSPVGCPHLWDCPSGCARRCLEGCHLNPARPTADASAAYFRVRSPGPGPISTYSGVSRCQCDPFRRAAPFLYLSHLRSADAELTAAKLHRALVSAYCCSGSRQALRRGSIR